MGDSDSSSNSASSDSESESVQSQDVKQEYQPSPDYPLNAPLEPKQPEEPFVKRQPVEPFVTRQPVEQPNTMQPQPTAPPMAPYHNNFYGQPQAPHAGYPMHPYPPPPPPPQQQNFTNNSNANQVNVNIANNFALNSGKSQWSQELCCPLAEPVSCALGTFCPVCLYCWNCFRIQPSIAYTAIICCLCPCALGGHLRTATREKYNIAGDSLSDCCAGYFCFSCVNCQIGAEIVRNNG